MKPTALLALLLACCAPLRAATIAVNNTLLAGDTANFHYGDSTTTVRLKDSSGALLPAGTDFRVGFFKNYSSSLDALLASSSFENLMDPFNSNGFVPIGVGDTGTGDNVTSFLQVREIGGVLRAITSIPNVSYLSGTPNIDADGLTRGTRLFLFLVNQPEFSGSPTEWGIFSASSWVIPAVGEADLTLAFKDVDTAAEVYRGKLGSLGTAPVPEPSVSLLALGALALGLRRRR